MKKIIILLSGILIYATTTSVTAQSLSKADIKAIKKELKQYRKDPSSYQEMIDKYEKTIKDQAAEIARLKASLDDCNTKLAASESQLSDCQKKVKELETNMLSVQNFDPSKLPAGKSYLVQIGYYTKFDLKQYFDGKKWLAVEETPEGKKYMISYFGTEEEAEKFAGDVRKLGIKDTWVVYYEDGKRLPNQARTKKTATGH